MRKNEKFDVWKKIKIGGKQECWPFIGSTFSGRYGRFFFNGKAVLAHRLVYELDTGNAPKDLFVMHKCNNKLCCNPGHLTLGTNSENQRHASSSNAFPVGITGVKGLSFDKKRHYWTAQGYLNGVKKNLYTGPHKDKALLARAEWEKQHGIKF
jgi:hypothetical protein